MNRLRGAILARMVRAPRWGTLDVLRDYEEFDPARSIDWRATARAGTIKVRERSYDRPIAWMAIVDESHSMLVGRHRPLFAAASEAARAWRAAASVEDRLIEPRGASRSLRNMLETAVFQIVGPTALLVTSDFYGLARADAPLLAELARKAHCAALVARDPWRDGFPLRGCVRVADAETGSLCDLFIHGRNAGWFARACRQRLTNVMRRLRTSGWHAADFGEEDGAAALCSLYGLE